MKQQKTNETKSFKKLSTKIYKSFVEKTQKFRERIRGCCIYIYIYIYKQTFLKNKKREEEVYIQVYIQPLYTNRHTTNVLRSLYNG